MYRNQYHLYPQKKSKSSTPDITLPALGSKAKEWTDMRRILCIDQSLNDSGAALFVNGTYIEKYTEDGLSIGESLTVSPNWTQQRRCVEYGKWISEMIEETVPDIVIGESHPFARGNKTTSIATLEALAGIRWITMYACGLLDIPYAEFSTNHVKLIMCGSSTASKDAIQMIIRAMDIELPKYRSKPDIINGNVCDAIAMGEVLSRMIRQEALRKEYISITGPGRSQTKGRQLSKKSD
jgi:Holliday junction resolvasome RuvABC endonuclease subunit